MGRNIGPRFCLYSEKCLFTGSGNSKAMGCLPLGLLNYNLEPLKILNGWPAHRELEEAQIYWRFTFCIP